MALSIVLLVTSADLALTATGEVRGVDRSLANDVYRLDSGALTVVMIVLTYLGTDPVLFLIAGVAIIWSRRHGRRRQGWILLGAALVARVAGIVLKFVLMMPRPTLKAPPWPLHALHGYGYPSGHALMSMVILGLVAVGVCRYGNKVARRAAVIGAPILIGGIGLSRVYLGLHWPNDVLGGYLVGLVIVVGALAIDRAGIEPRR